LFKLIGKAAMFMPDEGAPRLALRPENPNEIKPW
jgi:hypothetical protein